MAPDNVQHVIPRILFILPSLMTGGAEMQVIDLVAGLTQRGFVTHLLWFDPGTALAERARESGAVCHPMQRRGKVDLSLARSVAKIIDEQHIHIVHCSLMIALLYGWLGVTLSERRPALIAAVHTTINRNLRMDIQDRLVYQWLLRRCARVVFVCRAQREHWCRKYRALTRNSEVIHNGIDTGKFSRLAFMPADKAVPGVPAGPETRIVSQIAAFRPEKAHAVMLDAWVQVIASHPAARLVFAGEGSLRPGIQRRAEALGLGDSVLFLGRIEDVRPLLMRSDVVAMPSIESFSLAILEAMAMEVPVVATDKGGAGEAIDAGQTGELVAPGDPAGLATAISRLLESEAYRRRLGLAARAQVCERFDRTQMIDKTEELLGRVMRESWLRLRGNARENAVSGRS